MNIEAQFLQFYRLSLYDNAFTSQMTERRIQNSVKYLRYRAFFEYKKRFKAISYFLNSSILDVWLGSKYASEVCFSRVILNKISRVIFNKID